MTILLHGENSVASRNRLAELKTQQEVIEIGPNDPAPQITTLFAPETQIVIWSEKKLSATQIKTLGESFPDLKVEEFKIDPVVWRFLEALRPGNQPIFMPLWQKYLLTDPPEVAFIMIVRQFRLMLNPNDSTLASWMQRKITAQANTFGEARLKAIYKKLLDIDYAFKSGQSVVDFQTSLELFLLTL